MEQSDNRTDMENDPEKQELDLNRRAVLSRFGSASVAVPAMVVMLTAQSSEAWAGSGFGKGKPKIKDKRKIKKTDPKWKAKPKSR